jgi:5-bromo-4-chloroindolyl phosphate hydrolysis protein
MNSNTKMTLVIFLSLVFVVFGPILVIWSLNTLFKLNIEYNFNTWAATAFLSSVIAGAPRKS